MKILKIWITAISLGMLITSCQNSTQCATTKTDSVSSVGATNPGDSSKIAASALDTTGDNSLRGSDNAISGTVHTGNVSHRHRHSDTLAKNGPDLKASKKREGNFTNGTGADYPGK